MMRWVLRLLPLPMLILVVATLTMLHPHGIVDGAPEMAVVKAIVAINTAETQFYAQHGQYAASLAQLGHSELIDRDLASGQRGGFKFTVQPTPTGYPLTAAPLQFGTVGTHTYFSDQSMAIHWHDGREAATVADPLIGETIKEQRQTK